MVGVLGHRPERNRNIRPEVRVKRQPVACVAFAPPVFRSAFAVGVRRKHAPFDLNRIGIEIIFRARGAEPDIFEAVFPVIGGAAAFLALPGDPVPNDEIFFQNVLKDRR